MPEIEEDEGQTVPEYTAYVIDKLRRASELVREQLRTAAESASRWYDRRARPKQFEVGDPVRIYYPRRYTEGPQSGNHISALSALWSSVSMTLHML